MDNLTPIVSELFAFLAAVGIQPPVEIPPINFISSHEMSIMVNDVYGFRQQNLSQFPLGVCVNGVISLDSKINVKTVWGKSLLLHELTHYTQNKCPLVSKKDIMKIAMMEAQAYSVQNRWLEANNSPLRFDNPYGFSVELPHISNWKWH